MFYTITVINPASMGILHTLGFYWYYHIQYSKVYRVHRTCGMCCNPSDCVSISQVFLLYYNCHQAEHVNKLVTAMCTEYTAY